MPNSQSILTFDNLACRILYRYEFTQADFRPIETLEASHEAQRAFHDLCTSIIRAIAADPTLLDVPTDHPDATMPIHHTLNMYPDIYEVRNKAQGAFTALANLMYLVGLKGELNGGRLSVSVAELKKMTRKSIAMYTDLFALVGDGVIFGCVGGTAYFECAANPELLAAWQMYATKCYSAKNFLLGHYNCTGEDLLRRISELLGDDLEPVFFANVRQMYLAKGYREQFISDDYRAQYMLKKDISGCTIEFSVLSVTVRFLNINCIGIKAILEHFDELSDGLKSEFLTQCKKCNDCLGCTKGGKNKQFTVEVTALDGEIVRLCPEFVQMEWYNADMTIERAELLLELNELQAKYGKPKK